MINFNDLPGDIKSMIYKVNREAARDARYRQNYTDFVNNFKQKVEGDNTIYDNTIYDNTIYNDIIYHWKERGCVSDIHDIVAHKRSGYRVLTMKDIKAAIDDGLVYNF